MNEPPPQKLPPWVKKEILLPVLGTLLIGLLAGNYLVYRAIKKERRYSPTGFGPMDHRPIGIQPIATNNPPVSTNAITPPPQ